MSGPSATVLAIPEPLETDDDDVSWALQTAAVQWKRGARDEAIAWLRRGADAAVDGGLWERASQLNVIATSLEKAVAEQEPAAPPSAPRFPPRVPTPGSQSFPSPPSFRSGVPSAPAPVPQSLRAGAPSSSSMPISETNYSASAAPQSTPAAPHSKWPTGFPPSAVPSSSGGRGYAPPPPLPPSAKPAKAPPIPPIPPKPAQVRAPRLTAPEIQLGGVEELDMSEAELVEFAEEEVTYRGRVPAGVFEPEPLEPAPPSAPVESITSLPSYDLDEDPSDGTSALPARSSYPAPSLSSYPAPYASEPPPELIDDVSELPAFPLEDSVPVGPPSFVPAPQSYRSNPVPQISLRSPLPPAATSSKPPASGASQKFARPSSLNEVEESRPPSVRPRTLPPPPSNRAPTSERVARSVEPPSLAPVVSFSDFAPPSDAPPARGPSGYPPPMVSMDELEAIAAEPEFDEDEGKTSVPPPASERHDDTTDISRPPISLTNASFEPISLPPESKPGALLDAYYDDSSASPISLPPPSVAPASLVPPNANPVSSRPASSERASRPSARPSQPPQHLDRETPIPSSISGLKPVSLRGIELANVRGLCDLPEESQRLLRQRARIERMGTGEDLSFFSVVLVLEGWVKLMPAIADVTCATAAAGDVVFTQGTLEDGVALRVVAGQNGTTLATWDRETFDEITQSCPWVADELRLIADSFQALAGTSLGMLGERLDDALREVVTSRCQVLTLMPGEVLVQKGKTVPGMHIVGAGLIELVDETGTVCATVAPGDFLLTAQVLAGGVSPHTVRAANSGALVLFAQRMVAHELLVSVPPLLEILAG